MPKPIPCTGGRWVTVVALLCMLLPSSVLAGTVTLPMTIDWPLLRALLVMAAYTEPGEKHTVSSTSTPCRHVVLAEPELAPQGDAVRLLTRVQVQVATEIGGRCRMPVTWEGRIVLLQRPRVDAKSWALGFETLETQVLDREGQPAVIAGAIWELVQAQVIDYLESVRIDLSLPVSELKGFLWPLFPRQVRQRTQRMIDSLRPAAPQVDAKALRIGLVVDVETDGSSTSRSAAPEKLGADERSRLVEAWETWDAFLVSLLRTLNPQPLSDEERTLLLAVLLDARYRFVQALPSPTGDTDLVREEFIAAWERLSPIYRRHLGQEPSPQLLGYLAFFTSADALRALDALGPSLGIEISRNGLIRLLRLLSERKPTTLIYSPDLDPELRQTLGVEAAPPPSAPSEPDAGKEPLPPESRAPLSRGVELALAALLPRPAWAAEEQNRGGLERWLVTPDTFADYLPRLHALLIESAEGIARRRGLSDAMRGLYRLMMPAVAWQESCWRQFIDSNGQTTYLRSYNGSSVGMMQINERVWRGFYDIERLRWDIRYNTQAGTEIVDQYCRRYALPRLQRDAALRQQMAEEGLVRMVYAMYNAGPAELERFIERFRQQDFFTSDALFMEKLRWVKAAQWQNLSLCLFGAKASAG